LEELKRCGFDQNQRLADRLKALDMLGSALGYTKQAGDGDGSVDLPDFLVKPLKKRPPVMVEAEVVDAPC
jgi:hypothetical protein